MPAPPSNQELAAEVRRLAEEVRALRAGDTTPPAPDGAEVMNDALRRAAGRVTVEEAPDA